MLAQWFRSHKFDRGLAYIAAQQGEPTLELLAWKVMFLHHKDSVPWEVQPAVAEFLRKCREVEWQEVQRELPKIVGPILDQGMHTEALKVLEMGELAPHLAWIPRGLLVYALPSALRDPDPDMQPVKMLTWLARLAATEQDPRSQLTQIFLTLWSCDFDPEPKSVQVKLNVCMRKLANSRILDIKAKDFPNGNPSLHEYLILRTDYLWLLNRLDILAWRTQHRLLGQDSPDSIRMQVLKRLDMYEQSLYEDVPKSSRYWVQNRLLTIRAQTLAYAGVGILPKHMSQCGCQDCHAPVFTKFWNKLDPRVHFDEFLMTLPAAANMLPDWTVALPYIELYPVPAQLECLANFAAAQPLAQEKLKAFMQTGSFIPLADAQGVLRVLQRTPDMAKDAPSPAWSLVEEYVDANPFTEEDVTTEPTTARLTWATAALSCGLTVDKSRFTAIWGKVLEQLRPLEHLPHRQRCTFEAYVLGYIDSLLTSANFDDEIYRLAEDLRSLSHLSELVLFLALCGHVFCGTEHVNGLMKRLCIRGVQLYSTAWAIGGMERLWKVRRTAFGSGLESPERMLAQAGSTALMMLDSGHLSDVPAYFAQCQALFANVRARRYAEALERAVATKEAGALRAWDWSAELTSEVDLRFVLGPVRSLAQPGAGGLGELVVRLSGPRGGRGYAAAHAAIEAAVRGRAPVTAPVAPPGTDAAVLAEAQRVAAALAPSQAPI